ncbi:thioredoxin 1 [Dysgonomonas sp. PFB1-18]|uniref:thioredoxin n=1 Tax=unclassified Dysgonomonas TaxID=2630389 RepID=UPI0024760C43|nr:MULTISPECIES: thioredoxin [unclassified Dysgonomonas]MDH6310697.1 thioredoxin 1 [Dysgonomonas sp. PF1-14]MDH6340548.1 thioredoxin 1 [Dysgonomonas sp. PF1-16]MDH6382196.1 thioredoxin 1 [Dysgonomonas sp. PFB1-18]MDH6399539.1 thioredoxin 1 [Dysgonomonas sp. PF1-23]
MINKIKLALFASVMLTIGFPLLTQAKDKPKEKSPVVILSTSNYAKETEKGLVLVDFWAAWCAPCRRIAPLLEEIAVEYKDSVKIAKLNIDNYKGLAVGLGIQALPTIVVYKDGKEVTRLKGLQSKNDLINVVKTYSGKTTD